MGVQSRLERGGPLHTHGTKQTSRNAIIFPTLLLGTTEENTSYLPARTLAVTKELLFNTIRDRMQIR